MKKLVPIAITMLLLQVSCMVFGQESVKLFNNTGNEEVFSETYYYDEPIDQLNYHFHSSDGSLYWGAGMDIDPTRKYSTTMTKQERQFTDVLGEFLTHRDSVRIQVTFADKYSPVWILLYLKDELEARGITVDYPAQGKQPADYLVEISSFITFIPVLCFGSNEGKVKNKAIKVNALTIATKIKIVRQDI